MELASVDREAGKHGVLRLRAGTQNKVVIARCATQEPAQRGVFSQALKPSRSGLGRVKHPAA